jgi:putative transposase
VGGARRRVGIGDRILAAGQPVVVIGIAGTRVRMAAEGGTVSTATIAELVANPRFGFPAAAPPRGTRPGIGLEGLPAAAVEEASWREAHIAEVVYGLRPG